MEGEGHSLNGLQGNKSYFLLISCRLCIIWANLHAVVWFWVFVWIETGRICAKLKNVGDRFLMQTLEWMGHAGAGGLWMWLQVLEKMEVLQFMQVLQWI